VKATVACVGVGVLALAFPGCMPDFDGLTVGKSPPVTCSGANGGCSGSGGNATAGESATNGGSSAGGRPSGGSNGIAGTQSIAGTSGESGNTGDSGAAGEATSGGAGGGSGGTGGGSGGTGAGGKAGNGGSAGAAGAPCVTKFSGTVKYSFDNAGSAAQGVLLYPEDPTGKGPGLCTGPISLSATGFNSTEGHSCPGALELTIPFGSYASPNQITVDVNFGPVDWTAFSLLHAWVKIKTPDAAVAGTEMLSYLSQIQFSVASSSVTTSNDYKGYTSSTKLLLGWADRGWHEVTLGLIPSTNYYANAVLNIGVQIQSVGVKPATPADAPDAPPTTVVEIDDIWVE
jgi:hypothetical protein